MIESFVINGIVRFPNARDVHFWRIDDLESGRVVIDFYNHPAAFVRCEPGKADNGRGVAEAVCKALNAHRAKDQTNAIEP